jgi:hypothetical protein
VRRESSPALVVSTLALIGLFTIWPLAGLHDAERSA